MLGVFAMAPVADQKLTGLVAATFTPLTPQGLVVDLFFQPLSVLIFFCPALKDVFWQLKFQNDCEYTVCRPPYTHDDGEYYYNISGVLFDKCVGRYFSHFPKTVKSTYRKLDLILTT